MNFFFHRLSIAQKAVVFPLLILLLFIGMLSYLFIDITASNKKMESFQTQLLSDLKTSQKLSGQLADVHARSWMMISWLVAGADSSEHVKNLEKNIADLDVISKTFTKVKSLDKAKIKDIQKKLITYTESLNTSLTMGEADLATGVSFFGGTLDQIFRELSTVINAIVIKTDKEADLFF